MRGICIFTEINVFACFYWVWSYVFLAHKKIWNTICCLYSSTGKKPAQLERNFVDRTLRDVGLQTYVGDQWDDRVQNDELLQRTGKRRGLLLTIKRRKTAYLGHVMRHHRYSLLQLFLMGNIAERTAERRKTVWFDSIKKRTGVVRQLVAPRAIPRVICRMGGHPFLVGATVLEAKERRDLACVTCEQ